MHAFRYNEKYKKGADKRWPC